MRHHRNLAQLLIVAWLAVSAGAAQPTAQARGPADLATRFVAAWNAHDAQMFAGLVAADADWVTASGQRLKGRADIRDYLADEHRTWAKSTTMRARDAQVRVMDPKTVVVMFEWEIETPGEEGAAPTVARGNNLFVARLDADWLIVAGQVARIRPR